MRRSVFLASLIATQLPETKGKESRLREYSKSARLFGPSNSARLLPTFSPPQWTKQLSQSAASREYARHFEEVNAKAQQEHPQNGDHKTEVEGISAD